MRAGLGVGRDPAGLSKRVRLATVGAVTAMATFAVTGTAIAAFNDEAVGIACGGSGCVSARVQSQYTGSTIEWRARGATDPNSGQSIYLRLVTLTRFETFRGDGTETVVGLNGQGGQCFCPVVRFTDIHTGVCGGFFAQSFYSTVAGNYNVVSNATASGCRV